MITAESRDSIYAKAVFMAPIGRMQSATIRKMDPYFLPLIGRSFANEFWQKLHKKAQSCFKKSQNFPAVGGFAPRPARFSGGWGRSPLTTNSDTFKRRSMNSLFEKLLSARSAKTNRQKLLYVALSSIAQNPVSLDWSIHFGFVRHPTTLLYLASTLLKWQLGASFVKHVPPDLSLKLRHWRRYTLD